MGLQILYLLLGLAGLFGNLVLTLRLVLTWSRQSLQTEPCRAQASSRQAALGRLDILLVLNVVLCFALVVVLGLALLVGHRNACLLQLSPAGMLRHLPTLLPGLVPALLVLLAVLPRMAPRLLPQVSLLPGRHQLALQRLCCYSRIANYNRLDLGETFIEVD